MHAGRHQHRDVVCQQPRAAVLSCSEAPYTYAAPEEESDSLAISSSCSLITFCKDCSSFCSLHEGVHMRQSDKGMMHNKASHDCAVVQWLCARASRCACVPTSPACMSTLSVHLSEMHQVMVSQHHSSKHDLMGNVRPCPGLPQLCIVVCCCCVV